ncbi:MAG TPA: hypothetical protein VKU19_22255 [Bryobacteraceae bacterium]|nr:hypothetical protein [Bryobacteraceae bacterium]
MKRIALLLVSLAGLSTLLQAQAPDCPGLVDQVMQLSGATDLINSLPQVQTQMESVITNSELTAVERQRLRNILRGSFLPAKITSGVRERFVSSCDPENLQAVAKMMSTPLAVKMKKLEAYSLTPQGMREMGIFTNSLYKTPADPDRVALMDRLDDATGSSAFTVELVLATIRGMFTGAGHQLDAATEALVRKQAEAGVEKTSWICDLATYRKAEDDEVDAYAALYRNPAVAKFNDEFKAAFLAVVEKQSGVAGTEVKRTAAPSSSSRPAPSNAHLLH